MNTRTSNLMNRNRRRAGFTLMELLVVIGILGILAGLLLPAMARVQAKARLAQCLAGTSQLARGWLMYANDHDDRLVTNGNGEGPQCWVMGSYIHRPDEAANPALLVDPQHALLAPYLSTARVYKCPADRTPGTSGTAANPRVRSYSMNGYVGWAGPQWIHRTFPPFPNRDYRLFARLGQITDPTPANLLVFQETNPDSICRPCFGTLQTPGAPQSFFNYPASYHDRGGVNTFADGHAEAHRWRDPRTVQPGPVPFHVHNIPSPNNPDLVWMHERTTRPK